VFDALGTAGTSAAVMVRSSVTPLPAFGISTSPAVRDTPLLVRRFPAATSGTTGEWLDIRTLIERDVYHAYHLVRRQRTAGADAVQTRGACRAAQA